MMVPMRQEIMIHAGIPLAVLGVAIVLTRSDLVRRLVAAIRREPLQLPWEFEMWLLTLKGGGFLHKLWTCALCHAFHTSWVAVLAVASASGERDPLQLAGAWGFCFVGAYLALRGNSAPSQQAVAAETYPEDWPEPEKDFLQRLKVEKKTGEGVARTVDISTADPLVAQAVGMMTGNTACSFPECERLKEAMRRDIETAKEDPDCPDCRLGEIRRKYFNHAIAFLGG